MKIPDDVFETRCRYCFHGQPHNGNVDVPESKIFLGSYCEDRPCKIFGIAKFSKVPGECLSFSPRLYFGICHYCAHNNSFVDGFCTLSQQPNKRQLFLGHGGLGGAYQPDYWQQHSLSTCDNYKVSHFWLDLIVQAVTDGRSPANFDPITLEPIEKSSRNFIAEEWQEIRAKAQADREAATQKQTAEHPDPDGGQFKLF